MLKGVNKCKVLCVKGGLDSFESCIQGCVKQPT